MEEMTKKLLKECSSGLKMAINSIDQVSDHVSDNRLSDVIQDYKEKHQQLEKKTDQMLIKTGAKPKEPGISASAFSWFSTEMKLKMHDDNQQVAKLMMDGCNMGIQSIGGFIHDYTAASPESISLAEDIIETEEAFMKELKAFL